MFMFYFLALAAVSIPTHVMGKNQVIRTSAREDMDQLEQGTVDLAESPVVRRRLEEEIVLEPLYDNEEQSAALDSQFSDLLQPLHNHHEFQDLLTTLHSDNWADGCRSVFLDVGTGRGTNIRMLFEPELYENASALPLLEQYFGPASTRKKHVNESGLCAFGFEANPRFAEQHRDIEIAYAAKGWKVQFFTPVVVYDHDGAEDFYIEDSPDTNALGSSIINPAPDRSIENNSSKRYYKQELPSARFAELVRTKVADRWLSEDDVVGKVFMYMNIVGAEFAVLPDLLQAGVLCQQSGIDGMLVIEHTQSLESANKSSTPWSELKDAIRMQNGCKDPSDLVEMDSDSMYIDAQRPLPLENATASETTEHDGDLIV